MEGNSMRKHNAGIEVLSLTAFVLLCVVTLVAQENTKLKGLIVARDGANMIVKSDTGNTTVRLSDDTKVQAVKGKFGLRRKTLELTDLIPGLPVEVQGTQNGDQFAASNIKFKADDLKTALQIQAGVNPTQQQLQSTQEQVEANQKSSQANQQSIQNMQGEQAALSKRFGELGDYDVKGQITAYFPVNGTALSAEDKQQLKELAASAVNLSGYMILVAGYTDSLGSAAYNQELSDRRAEAVINFLQQECRVPLYRVLAPAAMGESDPVGSNETVQGMSKNRRVEVKILVNRGTAN
jgi:OmpA-OmpF porin, OOP family